MGWVLLATFRRRCRDLSEGCAPDVSNRCQKLILIGSMMDLSIAKRGSVKSQFAGYY
jgi:hypothetical protein